MRDSSPKAYDCPPSHPNTDSDPANPSNVLPESGVCAAAAGLPGRRPGCQRPRLRMTRRASDALRDESQRPGCPLPRRRLARQRKPARSPAPPDLEDGLGGAELGRADEGAARVVRGEDGRAEVDEPHLRRLQDKKAAPTISGR